ncbi:DDE-TNP-IS1595 domain-containing protein [Vairimorpha necatrix]|uniref:DDE-TNP-IS1595 domain-containing protein n=1 Tax=Vairimorpha necatrix TaxID=6039 RepID=A0AAX4J9K2_9MICR
MIIMILVDDSKSKTLKEIIKNYVYSESIIHSDCSESHLKLKEYFSEHKIVNHSLEFWIKNETSTRNRTRTLITGSLIRYMLRRNFEDDLFTNSIKLNFFF